MGRLSQVPLNDLLGCRLAIPAGKQPCPCSHHLCRLVPGPAVVRYHNRTLGNCTSGSTSSNTSLILFFLVSCAYPRPDRWAEPPPSLSR